MFFSERFQISSELLKEYGAVDISLVCDIPLFIDPMLIFNSEKEIYKNLHKSIIRYFHFLYTKAEQGLTMKEVSAWFNFSEVPNNWLGYSLVGNKGLALGKEYAKFLYENIAFAINTHGISKSQHIEKVMLLYDGSGKDRSIRERSIRKIEKDAFKELVREHPELYDYYIRLRETDVDKIRSQSLAELNEQIEKLCVASQKIISLFKNLNYQTNEQLTAREEAKARLRFFKHIIEDCDGYKNLYTDGKQIAKENDLQRLFRFVWYGTSYKVDAEPNNGRGQADFIVSMGQNNQNIVEFKLASNSTLSHVFTQVKIYEAANCTDGSLIAIFCFSESEYLYSEQVVKAAGYEELLGESIYLIDCRNDNKKSASIA